MQRHPVEGVSACPVSTSLDMWTAVLEGQPGTPYIGGTFRLHVHFPQGYPFEPPMVQFVTRIFHPNINCNGSICMDLLGEEGWTPAVTVQQVLRALLTLMAEPNPDDPLAPEVAAMYKTDRAVFDSEAQAWTARFAVPDGDDA